MQTLQGVCASQFFPRGPLPSAERMATRSIKSNDKEGLGYPKINEEMETAAYYIHTYTRIQIANSSAELWWVCSRNGTTEKQEGDISKRRGTPKFAEVEKNPHLRATPSETVQ